MRFFFALIISFLVIFPCFCADKAVEPSYIYDEILDASNYKIVKYNHPAGSRELNIFGLKNMGQYNLNSVAAPDYHFLAYSEVYFYPDIQVTASALYLIPLESNMSKRAAILSVSTKDKIQVPIIETNYTKLYPFKFNSFTVVDWNKTSNMLLFKEKLGQNFDQIYLTKLHVFDMSTETLYDLNILRTKIIEYWASQKLFLEDYKWDIKPLGFLSFDETKIIANAYGYYQNERKFLGTWVVDYQGKNAFLYTLEEKKEPSISSNGTCLKFIPDMGDIFKEQRKRDAKTKQRYIEPK